MLAQVHYLLTSPFDIADHPRQPLFQGNSRLEADGFEGAGGNGGICAELFDMDAVDGEVFADGLPPVGALSR